MLKKVKYYSSISLIKTLLFNFYYLRFGDALKFPFLIGRNIKIGSMGKRNSVKLKLIRLGVVQIGIGKGSFQMGRGAYGYWNLIGDA